MLSAAATCSGCETDGVGVSKRGILLPAAPAFMAPVPVPPVKVGDDARLAWKKTGAALSAANGQLAQSREWYIGVRGRYGSSKLR